jgi:hypothetical protein
VSILIGLGEDERAGRWPSNVSTMIIRPPQHGHRREDEDVSVSLSAFSCKRSAEVVEAARAVSEQRLAIAGSW